MNGSGLIFTCKRLFKIAVAMLIFILATTHYTPAYAKSVLNRLNINFESGFDKEAVQEILSRHYGKEVTVDLLRIVLDEVDHYFHEHGYPTSKAYFPLQQSGNGVLDITVISPYLEEVRFKNRANINIQTRRRLNSDTVRGSAVKSSIRQAMRISFSILFPPATKNKSTHMPYTDFP